MSTPPWATRQRLCFIERAVAGGGILRRADLMERFDISINQASADLTRYQAMAPDNLRYDKSGKCYRAGSGFAPALPPEWDEHHYLRARITAQSDIISRYTTLYGALPTEEE